MRSGLSERDEHTEHDEHTGQDEQAVSSAEEPDPTYEPREGTRNLTHRDADWSDLHILVTGLGVSGFAAADALSERGAIVSVVSADATGAIEERARILEILDVDVRLGPEHLLDVPEGTELVVTSPGFRPGHPLLVAAAARGIPVWGEVELAWRMRAQSGAAPWITITGTNGKTTTVQMLACMLRAAGLRATSAGNVGTPLLEAVLHPDPYDVLAVELSSFQLHWQRSVAPFASACLNVAPDHLDWHGSMQEYQLAKAKVYAGTRVACVYNVQDPATEQMVMDADVVEGCRAIGFTLGVPGPSMVGLVDDVLADRAFVEQRKTSAAELATLADVQGGSPSVAPHNVANALAAAALARAYGVGPLSVRDGLRDFVPDPHRIAEVATVDGVRFIDDSKATNPHAAGAALVAFESVVWVAGGLLKGADVEELVKSVADRLRGVILIGADRDQIATALRRHAPDVPVVDVPDTDTGVMDLVVARAGEMAQPGDVVLLAPAAASMDMFVSYSARGDAFAAAVHRHANRDGGAAT
jgi:UDP-N-acetylmuramoylalanine--D-glutamate ligase